MPASPDTLLRMVRQMPEYLNQKVRVVGVDDWAFRKGHRYGTILVDLEKYKVIELLENRTAECLKTWPQTHPKIEVVSRDRSKEYEQDISQGAPHAIQVAGRWHLINNAKQMTEKWCKANYKLFREVANIALSTESKPVARNFRFLRSKPEEEASRTSREKRLELYHEVQRRYLAGESIRRIGREMDIHRETVRTYLSNHFPERNIAKPKPSIIDPYLPYLEKRMSEGCENASLLWKEIREMGFPGTRKRVSQWVQIHRSKPSPSTPTKFLHTSQANSNLAKMTVRGNLSKVALPSAKEIAGYLSRSPEKLGEEEQSLLEVLLQDQRVKEVHTKVRSFITMISKRHACELDD